jgi:glycosyltransferase involved in cell wall biosynthesis
LGASNCLDRCEIPMKITVTTPCYQEIRFVKAWCENVLGWSDLAIISEGGSTDGTREVLADYEAKYPGRFQILNRLQADNPMRYGFNESARRQEMNSLIMEGVQVFCDMDEMMPDDTRERIQSELPPLCVGKANWINFWRSPNYMRIGVFNDAHWGPLHKHCIYWAGRMNWQCLADHPSPISVDRPVLLNLTKFHYHYLYGQAKTFENRIEEYVGLNAGQKEIQLRTIHIKHPKAFGILEERARFADMQMELNSSGEIAK